MSQSWGGGACRVWKFTKKDDSGTSPPRGGQFFLAKSSRYCGKSIKTNDWMQCVKCCSRYKVLQCSLPLAKVFIAHQNSSDYLAIQSLFQSTLISFPPKLQIVLYGATLPWEYVLKFKTIPNLNPLCSYSTSFINSSYRTWFWAWHWRYINEHHRPGSCLHVAYCLLEESDRWYHKWFIIVVRATKENGPSPHTPAHPLF